MLLTGTGDYDSRHAYLIIDWLGDPLPDVRGTITSVEPAAFPEPVPAPAE